MKLFFKYEAIVTKAEMNARKDKPAICEFSLPFHLWLQTLTVCLETSAVDRIVLNEGSIQILPAGPGDTE